jgi:pimeloyl-ACP methyl ester carboxylesterase
LRSTHHCIAVDLRGHGDSDWAESYRIADHVSDIVRVAEGFKLDRAHIVGMSLGGVVAAYVALDSSGFDAASLALVDVAPGVVFENTRRLRAFVRDSAVADGVDALIEQARRYGARGSEAQLYYRYSTLIRPTEKGGWRWKYDPDGADFPHILNHIAMLDSRAGEMRLPLLVVRGGSSQILSDAAAARFAGLCPQGRWCVVADAGHTVQEDNPLGLSEALIQFWSSRPALR